MPRYYLNQDEISDISKILCRLLTGQGLETKMNESSLYLMLKWLKEEGIDTRNLGDIVHKLTTEEITITEKVIIQEIWQIFRSELYNDDRDYKQTIKRDSRSLFRKLTEVSGIDKDLCNRTLGALKAILPQKQVSDLQYNQRLLHAAELKDKVYGILSYDGPVIAICDTVKRQIVKGIVITKEDNKGSEHTAVRLYEIILEAIPIEVAIYDVASDIEAKYEIKWRTYLNSSFVTGPASLQEIITILKHKSLVLQANICDSALISIFKAFVECGKAAIHDKLPISFRYNNIENSNISSSSNNN